MDKFFRDTLKKQLEDEARSGRFVLEVDGPCQCYNFIIEVANGRRSLFEWKMACESTEGHKCLCSITEHNLLFGELIEGCKKIPEGWHDCTCVNLVIPSAEMIRDTDDASVRPGYLMCKEKRAHACICRKFNPDNCRSGRNHDCICSASGKIKPECKFTVSFSQSRHTAQYI